MRIKTTITFIVFNCCVAFAQPKGDLLFNRLGKEDGLPKRINDIVQDTLGFMWLATYNGLCRYDGYTIKVYLNDANDSTSIASSRARSIFRDSKGTIWVGTTNGLSKYDAEKDRFANFLAGEYIRKIAEASTGDLWLGTDSGLYLFDTENYTYTQYAHDDSVYNSLSFNSVISVLEDSKGRVWAGTDGGGLNLLDGSDGNFVHFKSLAEDSTSLSNNKVLSIFEDRNQNIWFGTTKGLCRYNEATNNFQVYSFEEGLSKRNLIFDMVMDAQGLLWLASYKGLLCLEPKSRNFQVYGYNATDPFSISSNSIRTLSISKDSVLWVGTSGYASTHNFSTQHISRFVNNPEKENSLHNNVLGVLVDSKNNVWLSTSSATGSNIISVFDVEAGVTRRVFGYCKDNTKPFVGRIFKDRKGNVCFLTSNLEVKRYNSISQCFESFLPLSLIHI